MYSNYAHFLIHSSFLYFARKWEMGIAAYWNMSKNMWKYII